MMIDVRQYLETAAREQAFQAARVDSLIEQMNKTLEVNLKRSERLRKLLLEDAKEKRNLRAKLKNVKQEMAQRDKVFTPSKSLHQSLSVLSLTFFRLQMIESLEQRIEQLCASKDISVKKTEYVTRSVQCTRDEAEPVTTVKPRFLPIYD